MVACRPPGCGGSSSEGAVERECRRPEQVLRKTGEVQVDLRSLQDTERCRSGRGCQFVRCAKLSYGIVNVEVNCPFRNAENF